MVKAIDNFCRQKEWAMNVGDEKGTDFLMICSMSKISSLFDLTIYF